MRKLTFLLVVMGTAMSLRAQITLQHPGSICCNQTICEGDSLGLIIEELPTTPPNNQIAVEYAWHELVSDTTTPTGTKWRKIPNTNTRMYQPTSIALPYGGFFMRAARKVGTTGYLFSNVANIKVLGASSSDCTSSSVEAPSGTSVVIFPNPATNLITIVNQNEAIPLQSYQVFTIQGHPVGERQQVSDSKVTLDIDPLPSGVYLLQVYFSDGKRSLQKWIKL